MLHKVFALPEYVIRYAPNLMGDRAFVVVINLIGANTKTQWEDVAHYLSYKSIAPLKTIVKNLADNGLVTKRGYKLDWMPLFDKCYHLAIGGELPTIETPPKKEPDHAAQARHALYHDMLTAAPTYLTGAKGQWVGSGKNKGVIGTFIDDYDREDVIGCCAWMESYFKETPVKGVDSRGIYSKTIIKNIDKWIAGGRKESYISEKDFSNV